MKAVGYVRVSTDEQADEGYSLAAQERAIRSFCDAKSWQLVKVYRDEGLSAFTGERRPGYEAMVEARGSWDVIVSLKMDRLWRNMRAFLSLMDELGTWKKGFVSIGESWDTTTPMGTFVRDLFARLAQLESEQTSYRVKMAFRQKFEGDGNTWYTRAPLGYDLVDGKLIVNEREAEIVRSIFERVRAGDGTHDLVARFAREGRRGKNGGKLHQVSILQIVHNPAYAGYVYYSGVLRKNGHEAIVPVEAFNVTQVALYVRTRKHHRYPLLLGPARLEAVRKGTAGPKAQAVYIPKIRPPQLDDLVAAETGRTAQRPPRRGRSSG